MYILVNPSYLIIHLYVNNTSVWIKRKGAPYFDIPMGSFDSANICELVSLYFLNVLD